MTASLSRIFNFLLSCLFFTALYHAIRMSQSPELSLASPGMTKQEAEDLLDWLAETGRGPAYQVQFRADGFHVGVSSGLVERLAS